MSLLRSRSHSADEGARGFCQVERESELLRVRGPDDVLIGDHQPTPSTLLLLRHTCRWFAGRAQSSLERLHNRLIGMQLAKQLAAARLIEVDQPRHGSHRRT